MVFLLDLRVYPDCDTNPRRFMGTKTRKAIVTTGHILKGQQSKKSNIGQQKILNISQQKISFEPGSNQ